MDRLVDHLFVFEGDGVVRDFPGNYTNYRLTQRGKDKEVRGDEISGRIAEAAPANNIKEKRKLSFKEKTEYENLEKDIAKMEAEKVAISEKMSDATLAYDELQKLGARLIEISNLTEQKEMRWLELSELV